MKFDKRISKLLAKFMLVSTGISCFGCCSYAMEDKDVEFEKKYTQLMADEILRHACYMVVGSDDFRTLVQKYVSTNECSDTTKAHKLQLSGRLLALDILKNKEKFSALLPQFAKYYVENIMTKQEQKEQIEKVKTDI